MSLRKLLPVALVLAIVSIRCAGSPAEPIGTVSLTQTTTTTTTSIIPAVVAGTISASPGGTGIAGATLYNFSISDASGGVPPYTVTWNFGDGQAGAGNVAPHVFVTPGTFTVRATVADSRGMTAQANPVNVSVRTVTGTWKIRFQGGNPPGDESVDLVQNGTAVAATVNDTNNLFGLGTGAGTVANPRALSVNLTFRAGTPQVFAVSLIGSVDPTVTEWRGFAGGYPNGCGCDFVATRNSAPGVLSIPR
jgi:hypothetical protein